MNSLLIVLVALVLLTSCRNITRLGPVFDTYYGEWGSPEYCPEGYFAMGFMIKQEAFQREGDDTATNAIRLICDDNDRTTVTSSEGDWGTWHTEQVCRNNGRICGFRLKEEGYQDNGGDNTAVNGVAFICCSAPLMFFEGRWGTWRDLKMCPYGRAICGIQARVQKYRPNRDDVALADIAVYCCLLI